MQTTGNTILITGGGSGIGRGLAEAFHAAGNQVVIAGRRRDALEEVVAANPGMAFQVLNVDDPAAIRAFAVQLTADHPALNVLINNAGIMRAEHLLADGFDLADSDATIATNLVGPIHLTAALLPHLRRQPRAAVINVTSGLAYVPRADTPTYCATKAALRSYTESLRYQLRHTPVQVVELAPPLVATDLTPGQRANPRAMPLDDFVRESVALLQADPDATHVYVDRVKFQRYAEAEGRYDAAFNTINPAS